MKFAKLSLLWIFASQLTWFTCITNTPIKSIQTQHILTQYGRSEFRRGFLAQHKLYLNSPTFGCFGWARCVQLVGVLGHKKQISHDGVYPGRSKECWPASHRACFASGKQTELNKKTRMLARSLFLQLNYLQLMIERVVWSDKNAASHAWFTCYSRCLRVCQVFSSKCGHK